MIQTKPTSIYIDKHSASCYAYGKQITYNTVHPTGHVHMTKHNMQIPLLQTTIEHASHSKALSSTDSAQTY